MDMNLTAMERMANTPEQNEILKKVVAIIGRTDTFFVAAIVAEQMGTQDHMRIGVDRELIQWSNGV